MKTHLILCLVAGSLVLSACSSGSLSFSSNGSKVDEIVDEVQEINAKLPPLQPVVIAVSGYGTVAPQTHGISEAQRQLIAMRASKLDAYRALAERVYGAQIMGSTTVENLVVRNDKLRSYVDATVLGAKVISLDELSDGVYETRLEMIIDEGFRNCLVIDSQTRRNNACASEVLHGFSTLNRSSLRGQGVSDKDTGLYFIE